MPRDARFWRNLTIIALGHIVLGIVLIGWSRESKKLEPPTFVWISDTSSDAKSDKSAPEQTKPAATEPPDSRPDLSKEEDEIPVTPEKATSEIQLPIVTPSPTPVKTPAPKPTASPTPKPISKRTPTPTPAPKSKTKKPKPKPTATPSPKNKKDNSSQKKSAADKPNKPKATPGSAGNADKKHSGATGPGGSSRASEFGWYAKMLHDRFYSEWVQPTTSVPAGAKMSVLVRIRIERDGRISKFNIARPSGNVVVDESVQAISKRVTQVEPIPAGLGAGNYYEVNINFELNPTQ